MQNSESTTSELGNSLGQLKSTTEGLQKIVCGIAVMGGIASGFASGAGDVGSVAILIPVTLLLAGVIYFAAKRIKRFSDHLELFEHGLQLTLHGKSHRFRFSDVEQFRISETHHVINGGYAGTRANIEIALEGQLRPIKCDFECHQAKPTGQLISQVNQRLANAVRDRLSVQLERDGQLRWSPNVYLTMDGLKIADDPGSPDREIAMEQIDRWEAAGNQLRFWKQDEGMPFLVMPIDVPNVNAIGELFASLHACYRQQDGELEEVLA